MNLRDLKYIILVDKLKHFGLAANEGNISQPALSMQIKKLEDELGVAIFERSNKKVFTTEVGKKIIKIAQEALINIDSIKEIAKTSQNPFSGDLKIGAFPTLAPYLFPKIIPDFLNHYPELNLFPIEEKTDILIEQLSKGEIDIALLALPIGTQNFVVERIFSDKFFLAVPQNHKFSQRKTINQAELAQEKLLLLQEGHCLRDQALNLCNTIGAIENQSYRASSLETLRQMVASSVGITLIPEIALDNNSLISYIPFEKPDLTREIALVWRESSPRDQFFREILALFKFSH